MLKTASSTISSKRVSLKTGSAGQSTAEVSALKQAEASGSNSQLSEPTSSQAQVVSLSNIVSSTIEAVDESADTISTNFESTDGPPIAAARGKSPQSGAEEVQKQAGQEDPVSDPRAWVDPTLNSDAVDFANLKPEHWADLLPKLNLSGVTLSLASNCAVDSLSPMNCGLTLSKHHGAMLNNTHEKRISAALSKLFGQEIKVLVSVGEAKSITPAEIESHRQAFALADAVEFIENDDKIKKLIDSFDGKLERDSIKANRKRKE